MGELQFDDRSHNYYVFNKPYPNREELVFIVSEVAKFLPMPQT